MVLSINLSIICFINIPSLLSVNSFQSKGKSKLKHGSYAILERVLLGGVNSGL